MTKTKTKIAVVIICAALLITASVIGTVAYLSATDEATNTFTVGNVALTLDEAKVNTAGEAIPGAERVKANAYKLVPGHTYIKDPTVTVTKGSEESYVRMLVTFTKSAELDAIFAPNGADLTSIFNGYVPGNWTYVGNTKDTEKNTRTYEFRYKETVGAPTADVVLPALFQSFTLPGTVDKEKLKNINDMEINIVAQAIQADGFDDADAAWAEMK